MSLCSHPTRALLTATLWLLACSTPRAIDVSDAGTAPDAGTNSDAGPAYTGYVDFAKSQQVFTRPFSPAVSYGLVAQFFPSATPYRLPTAASAVAMRGLAALCGSAQIVGQCCSVPDSVINPFGVDTQGELAWGSITCTHDTDGGDGSVGVSNRFGSVTAIPWSSGDQLEVQGSGGVVGTFAGQLRAPVDVAGVDPVLFPADGGTPTVPRSADLAVTWTAGSGALPVVIIAGDSATSTAIVCRAGDTGSFRIPSALLGRFQAGDSGGVGIIRYAETSLENASTRVSVIVETSTGGAVVYQ